MNSPKILTNDENGNEIAGKKLTILSNTELDYNFHFETLPTSVFVDDSLKYSMAQVKMNFDRTDKSRAKIFSGYHAQTATFALLSLVSFSINLDSVPGRMGMLILLYLIQINTYNSFKGGLILESFSLCFKSPKWVPNHSPEYLDFRGIHSVLFYKKQKSNFE